MNIQFTKTDVNEGSGHECHRTTNDQIIVPRHNVRPMDLTGESLRSDKSSPRRKSQIVASELLESQLGLRPWMASFKNDHDKSGTKIRDERGKKIRIAGGEKKNMNGIVKFIEEDELDQVATKKMLAASTACDKETLANDALVGYRDEPRSCQTQSHPEKSRKSRSDSTRSRESISEQHQEQASRRKMTKASVVERNPDRLSFALQERSKKLDLENIDGESGIRDKFTSPVVVSSKHTLQLKDVLESCFLARVPLATHTKKADPRGRHVDEIETHVAVDASNLPSITKKKGRTEGRNTKDVPCKLSRQSTDRPKSPVRTSGFSNSRPHPQDNKTNLKQPLKSCMKAEPSRIEWVRNDPAVRSGLQKINENLMYVSSLSPKPLGHSDPKSRRATNATKALSESSRVGNIDPFKKEGDMTSITSTTTESGDGFDASQKTKNGFSRRSVSPIKRKTSVTSNPVFLARMTHTKSPQKMRSDVNRSTTLSDEHCKTSRTPKNAPSLRMVSRATMKGFESPRKRSCLPPVGSSMSHSREKTNPIDWSHVFVPTQEELSSVTLTKVTSTLNRGPSKTQLDMFLNSTKRATNDVKNMKETSWPKSRKQNGVKVVSLRTENTDLQRSVIAGTLNRSRLASNNMVPLDFSEFDADDFSIVDFDEPPVVGPWKTTPLLTSSSSRKDSTDQSFFPMSSVEDFASWPTQQFS